MFSTRETLGIELPYYGFMTGLGILACFLVIKFITMKRRKNIEGYRYVIIGVVGGICGFIMAHIVFAVAQHEKLYFVFTHLDRVFSSFTMFALYAMDIFGGMVFYGGLIGACIGAYISMKTQRLDVRSYSDTIVPCIPLFHAFGRIGCFLAGCCYGVESDFGFVYRHSLIESANGVRRLPIQLIESGENIVIFIVLLFLLCRCKNLKNGILIWIYGLIYPVLRFINEFFRGDISERGYFGALSTSQWLSIFIFAFSLFMLIRDLRKRDDKNFQSNT
ncbi:prolipoprotein diacylglyceryl transferase [Ruminococcus sp.]|uniref:prolipoprotein diacylglyceryl transferase n=1 Tax=Ruminococcus sp. TaxID=41978 RepID=UPI00351FFC6C